MSFDPDKQGALFLTARSNLAQADSMRSVAQAAGAPLDRATQIAYIDAAATALAAARAIAVQPPEKPSMIAALQQEIRGQGPDGTFKLDGTRQVFDFGPPTGSIPVYVGKFVIPEGAAGKKISVSKIEGGFAKMFISKVAGEVGIIPKVADLMTKKVADQGIGTTVHITVTPDMKVGDVWYFMLQHEQMNSTKPSVIAPQSVAFKVIAYPPS